MIDRIKVSRKLVLVPGNRLNLFTGFYLHDMFMNFDEILVGVGNVCIQSGLFHVFQKLIEAAPSQQIVFQGFLLTLQVVSVH